MCPLAHLRLLASQFLSDAYTQQPTAAAQCLNNPISVEEVKEGLTRLHNGGAKGRQGLASEFLRYAQPEQKKGEPQPEHALLPSMTAVLNAAFSHGGGGLSTTMGTLSAPVQQLHHSASDVETNFGF